MTLWDPAPSYLAAVKDWEDPFTKPIIEQVDRVLVVRDDLLKYGAKIRFADYLIRTDPTKEWVYGSSPRWGYAQVSLAYLCARYKKRCALFLPLSKVLHPYTQMAKDLGAKIIPVPMGFTSVTEARAKSYVAIQPHSRLLPMGLAHPTVYGSIIKVARSLSINPHEIWTVAGSGTLNRGLQMAWPEAKAFMVSVGHCLSSSEAANATVIKHPLKFSQQCKPEHRPPFPSVLEYDSKAWEFVQARANNKRKTVLFWNVA